MSKQDSPYVYKVVSKWDAASHSGKSVNVKGPMCLTYTVGKRTRAPKGTTGIFVFTAKEDAAEYARYEGGFVLRCHYEGDLKKPVLSMVRGSDWFEPFRTKKAAIERMAAVAMQEGYRIDWQFPRGTVTVDAITPIGEEW
jgi:hypothetical protein